MPEASVSSPVIYQLRVVLCGVSPLVWRRLLVISETSLAQLHEILLNAFDWSGEHLHCFLIHGKAYGVPCLGGIVFREDARRVPLSRFCLHCGERFRYEYDFTADWKLDIRLEGFYPLKLQIVKRRQRAFKIIGLTWIVERSFAWLGRNRRLSKDYEYSVQSSETLIEIAATRLMLNRLAQA
jgi:transposase